MGLLELKARFGELAIEKIKAEDFLRKIGSEQQEVYYKIVEAEKEEVNPAVETNPEL